MGQLCFWRAHHAGLSRVATCVSRCSGWRCVNRDGLTNDIDFRARKSELATSGVPLAINLMEALGAAEEATQDRVTIYVPSRDRDGEPVEFEIWVERAFGLLSQVGGGATRMPPAQGAWRNPQSAH